MTDTTAKASGWSFLQAMTPSLNQCLVVIVTAVVSIGGTIATQRYAALPVAKVEPAAVKTIAIDPKMVSLEKKVEDVVSDLAAIRAELSKKAKRNVVSVPPKQ